MKCYSRSQGFTIIELMTVLLVTAILAALAVPGFNILLINNRSAAQSRTFFDALNYARTEAIKRAATVGVRQINNGANWQAGWFIWADSNGNNTYDAGTDLVLQQFPQFSGNATLTSSGAVVTEVIFDTRGAVSSGVATFHYLPGSGSQYCQDIDVNRVGRAYIKSVACP